MITMVTNFLGSVLFDAGADTRPPTEAGILGL